MGERKTLSKRTRFEIFKRDGFRCHYCGATPVQKVLRVDHVVPVAEGGKDDPANLITSCFDCNAGKAAVPLEKQKFRTEIATEAHREHAEQIREWLAIQRDVHAAKEEALDQIMDEWERRVGTNPRSLRPRLWKMIEEFGLPRLVEAFDIVAATGPSSESRQVPYLHGVLRRWREGPPPAKQPEPPTRCKSLPLARHALAEVNKAAAEAEAQPERFPTLADKWARLVDVFLVATKGRSEAREIYIRRARDLAVKGPGNGWRRESAYTFESWGVTLELRPDGGGAVRWDPDFDRHEHAFYELDGAINSLYWDIEVARHEGREFDLRAGVEDLFRIRRETSEAIDQILSLEPEED